MANIKIIPYENAEGKLRQIYEDLFLKRGKLAEVHMVHSQNPETLFLEDFESADGTEILKKVKLDDRAILDERAQQAVH